MITAEQIGTAKDYEESVVSVPEWGGDVRVRTLSMGARYSINSLAVKDGTVDNAKFAVGSLEYGIVDPKLTRAQAEAIVADRASEPIQRIVAEVWKLSGLKEQEAKNV